MYLAYIDASGSPLPIWKDKENYVLSSVVINERYWQLIDNAIKQIKIKHFPQLPNEEVEIHAKDMLNRDGLFSNLDLSKIYDIFTDVFNFITAPQTKITIMSIVIDKPKLRSKIDMEEWAYKFLFERLHKFIDSINIQNAVEMQPPEFCIMITDTEGVKKDEKLRTKLAPFFKKGTNFQRLDNLIEELFFTDSKLRNLSQIADCIAYCVRKKHRLNREQSFHTAYWNNYYSQLVLKFNSNTRGEYIGYGLKIFPL